MSPPPHRRILMTADAVGGVWVYATDLARSLCDNGYAVTLVVMGPAPTKSQLEPLRSVSGLEVEVTDLALEWMDPKGADIPRARDKLMSIAELAKPDVVHLNSFREAAFGWTSPVLVVAHSCVWSWWRECRGGSPEEAGWFTYAAAVASGLRAADAWVAPTAAFRDAVESIYRPRAHGRVVWNGVGVSSLPARRRPSILAAGRLWDPAKNLSALLDVATSLEWPIRLAGPLTEDGSTQAPRLPSGIEHLGTVPRAALLAQMSCADIFVSPALYEPFGLGVLEAAACGCALVLSDIPSFRELWNEAAMFVDPRDAASLGQGLHALCRYPALRARLQAAAARRARSYSLERMTIAYCGLYDELVTAPACRPMRRLAVAGGARA